MNFELKFSSANKEFTLDVDRVATLDRARIPSIYLVPREETITTTDQAAIRAITTSLLHAPITPARETRHGLLVQANGSWWLLYGTVEEEEDAARTDGRAVMRIRARMIGGHALQGLQRPVLGGGGGGGANRSVALTKKAVVTESALDTHRVATSKKRRRVAEPEAASPAVTVDAAPAPADEPVCKAARKVEDVKIAAGETKTAAAAAEEAPAVLDRRQRERLKKMIVTLLSLRGIGKADPSFRDLYQHTLQASSFALACRDRRRFAIPGASSSSIVKKKKEEDEGEGWEEAAMRISGSILSLFLD